MALPKVNVTMCWKNIEQIRRVGFPYVETQFCLYLSMYVTICMLAYGPSMSMFVCCVFLHNFLTCLYAVSALRAASLCPWHSLCRRWRRFAGEWTGGFWRPWTPFGRWWYSLIVWRMALCLFHSGGKKYCSDILEFKEGLNVMELVQFLFSKSSFSGPLMSKTLVISIDQHRLQC